MAFVRRVRTSSGATAVQVVEKRHGRLRIIEHIGSAHTPVQLAMLLERAEEVLLGGQTSLDLGLAEPAPQAGLVPAPRGAALFDEPAATGECSPRAGRARTVGAVSEVLRSTLRAAYARLGFDALDDDVFEQLVLARLVEPTSKLDSIRVLTELGVRAPHRNTIGACLKRATTADYRSTIAAACFEHAVTHGDVSLVLYDVTTLYFEASMEDELRRIGYSKERRVDPQIVVGLLVDRGGFPLEIGCFEGNHAETRTIIPIVRQFQDRHNLEEMVVVADAGMLSAANLTALDEAGLRFIVGSRVTKAPADLENYFHFSGADFEDGQVIDTITPKHGNTKREQAQRREPVWNPEKHEAYWRAVWQFSRKRAVRDRRTLAAQEERARAIIDGEKAMKSARFVTTTPAGRSLDSTALQRAQALVGLKGYVTNIPAKLVPAGEVITSYHDLWHVEQSFRMSKTDLRARPMFHRTRDAIEAHLTIVFAALAVARFMQNQTGLSLKKIITTLRPVRAALIEAGGTTEKIPAYVPADIATIVDQITARPGH